MTFEEWALEYYGCDPAYFPESKDAKDAWDHQQTEIDALRKECEQLRADLYKALDYIHEGEE